MSLAKGTILSRIRTALRDVPRAERPGDVPVARAYRHKDEAPHHALVEQFVDRLVDYKARVRSVRPDELPQAIADACAARGVRRLVVPHDVPAGWLPALVEALRDDGDLSYEALDTSDGVLTGCALGVAQTGTIMLDSGPSQGRRAITLVPDYHLCVVRAAQIVGLLPEAIAALQEAASAGRPLTFISGPSATSDIELSRVEGVHGPRNLEVLIVTV